MLWNAKLKSQKFKTQTHRVPPSITQDSETLDAGIQDSQIQNYVPFRNQLHRQLVTKRPPKQPFPKLVTWADKGDRLTCTGQGFIASQM